MHRELIIIEHMHLRPRGDAQVARQDFLPAASHQSIIPGARTLTYMRCCNGQITLQLPPVPCLPAQAHLSNCATPHVCCCSHHTACRTATSSCPWRHTWAVVCTWRAPGRPYRSRTAAAATCTAPEHQVLHPVPPLLHRLGAPHHLGLRGLAGLLGLGERGGGRWEEDQQGRGKGGGVVERAVEQRTPRRSHRPLASPRRRQAVSVLCQCCAAQQRAPDLQQLLEALDDCLGPARYKGGTRAARRPSTNPGQPRTTKHHRQAGRGWLREEGRCTSGQVAPPPLGWCGVRSR